MAGLREFTPTAYGAGTIPGMLLSHVAYGATIGALFSWLRGRPRRR